MGRISLFFLVILSWSYYLQPRSLRRLQECGLGCFLRLLKFRASVIRQNLEFAFPGKDTVSMDKRKKLFGDAYFHLAQLSLEIVMLLGPMKKFVESYGELRGLANWRAANEKGNGVLFLSSHVGNWEIMAATGALGGIDLMLVTKKLKPEWFHEAIERGRSRCRVAATYEPKTLRDVLGHLKKKGTVGIVLDQYAGPPVGVRVPMFGIPVGTHTVIATLAKRTGAPVVPVLNYRLPDGRVIVDIQPELEWKSDLEPERELAVNTAYYSEILEKHIKEHPEQWLWTHRRFKGDLSPLREREWTEGRLRASPPRHS